MYMLAQLVDMNLSTKHKISLHVEYEHQWEHHPLHLAFMIDDRIINLDISGQKYVTIDKSIPIDTGAHRFLLCCENKTDDNTITGANQKIDQDSFAVFKKFYIEDINLMQYITTHAYFEGKDGNRSTPSRGIWANGSWCLDFKVPVYDWILEVLF